ncbi:MAG: hypothetical protein VW076_09230, partial [Synechococcus sp.]
SQSRAALLALVTEKSRLHLIGPSRAQTPDPQHSRHGSSVSPGSGDLTTKNQLKHPGSAQAVNSTEFKTLYLAATLERLMDLTDTKGREYANSDDQLANFKRLSEQLGLSPEKVIMVYLTKHLDSISSFVRNPEQDLSEPIDGRIDDAILYLSLLKACING